MREWRKGSGGVEGYRSGEKGDGGVGVERWRWVEKNKGPRCLRYGNWEKILFQKPKGHGACDLGFGKR